MILLPVLVVLVGAVVVGAGLLFGGGPLGGGDGRSPARWLALLAAVPVGVLLLLLLAVVTVGVGRSDRPVDDAARTAEPQPETATTSVARAVTPTTDPTSVGPVVVPPPEGLGPIVQLNADPDTAPAAVGELEPGTVLRMRVRGLEPHTAGHAEQCVAADRLVCGNRLDIQAAGDGSASFQYLVTDDLGQEDGGRCRVADRPCSIVITSGEGAHRVALRTVFRDPLPKPGRIRVNPSRGVAEGDEIAVELEGFAPGEELAVELCAYPGRPERCGAPGPSVPVEADERGQAHASLALEAGPVGGDLVTCDRTSRCVVAVTSHGVVLRSNAVPLVFAKPPGVDYQSTRLAVGAAVAVVLLLAAGWLVRSTDWSPVGEAAAPEIDDADYADLDAIIAALPAEEEQLI